MSPFERILFVIVLSWACAGRAQQVPPQPADKGSRCNTDPNRVFHVIAYGGSNTYGKNLPRNDAYPAQLEKLLRSDGFHVEILNRGVNGITTDAELSELDSTVPEGTDLVIFQPGGNDKRHLIGDEGTRGNIVAILQRLQARKVGVIMSGNPLRQRLAATLGIPAVDELNQLVPENDFQVDGQHLTPEGYGVVAETLRPMVERIICTRDTTP